MFALVLLFCAVRQRNRIGSPEFALEGTHLDVTDLTQSLRFLKNQKEEGEKFVCLTVRSLSILLLGARSASAADAELLRHVVPLFVSGDMIRRQNSFAFANSLNSSADLSEMLQRIADSDSLLSLCGDTSAENQVQLRKNQVLKAMMSRSTVSEKKQRPGPWDDRASPVAHDHHQTPAAMSSHGGSIRRRSSSAALNSNLSQSLAMADAVYSSPLHFYSWLQAERSRILYDVDDSHVATSLDPVDLDVYVCLLMSPDLMLPRDIVLPRRKTVLNRDILTTQGEMVDDLEVPPNSDSQGDGTNFSTLVLRTGIRRAEHCEGKFAFLNNVESSALGTGRVTTAVEDWYQETTPAIHAFISTNAASTVLLKRQVPDGHGRTSAVGAVEGMTTETRELTRGTFVALRKKPPALQPQAPSNGLGERRQSLGGTLGRRGSRLSVMGASASTVSGSRQGTFELTSTSTDVKATLLQDGCLCTVTIDVD